MTGPRVKAMPMFAHLTPAEMHHHLRCQWCGYDRYSDELGYCDDDERPCVIGCCVELCCKRCGWSDSGFGPAGCSCQRRVHDARRRRLATMKRRLARRAQRRSRS